MIAIYGAHILNDHISSFLAFFVFQFFKILIFQDVRGVKGQKRPKLGKKLCLSHSVSGTVHQMIVIFGTHV